MLTGEDRVENWFGRQLARGLMLTRTPFMVFIKKYLSHYLTCELSEFHTFLVDRFETAIDQRPFHGNYMAPRGAAKSTIATLGYPLYAICEGLDQYIIIGSDTFSQAAQFLEHVKDELENNSKLRLDYPDACGKGSTWSKETIITRNGIRVDALGAGKKIRGRRHGKYRPTTILLDDPENDESAASPTQREKTRTWFNAGVLKAGQPDTNVMVVGTVINGECLVAKLDQQPGWDSAKFRSVIDWPERLDLWDQWERLYYEDEAAANAFLKLNWDDMHRGAKVLWPEREPLVDLMKMRAQQGHIAFMSEKQNEPVNPEQCRFLDQWFDDEIWYDTVPTGAYYFMACDPSLGNDAQKGDYAAILIGAWKPGERHVYIDGVIDRMPTTEINKVVIELHKRNRVQWAVFEDNGFQALLGPNLNAEAMKLGLNIPYIGITHTIDKKRRIERLGPYFQRRQVKFKRHNRYMKLLFDQSRFFGIADHDDGPDALEMLMTQLEEWAIRRGYA